MIQINENIERTNNSYIDFLRSIKGQKATAEERSTLYEEYKVKYAEFYKKSKNNIIEIKNAVNNSWIKFQQSVVEINIPKELRSELYQAFKSISLLWKSKKTETQQTDIQTKDAQPKKNSKNKNRKQSKKSTETQSTDTKSTDTKPKKTNKKKNIIDTTQQKKNIITLNGNTYKIPLTRELLISELILQKSLIDLNKGRYNFAPARITEEQKSNYYSEWKKAEEKYNLLVPFFQDLDKRREEERKKGIPLNERTTMVFDCNPDELEIPPNPYLGMPAEQLENLKSQISEDVIRARVKMYKWVSVPKYIERKERYQKLLQSAEHINESLKIAKSQQQPQQPPQQQPPQQQKQKTQSILATSTPPPTKTETKPKTKSNIKIPKTIEEIITEIVREKARLKKFKGICEDKTIRAPEERRQQYISEWIDAENKLKVLIPAFENMRKNK